MGILLAQQDARLTSDDSSQEQGAFQNHSEAEEQLSFRESLILGGIGLVRLFPALLLVMAIFTLFIAFLTWIWGL